MAALHTQPQLTSLPRYSELRANATSVKREERINVDIFNSIDDGEQAIALCHLVNLFPFTDGTKSPINPSGTYEGAAAIALAAQHLNVGDGSIVPEVEKLNERCRVRFTVELADTELSESVAVEEVIELTDRTAGEQLLPCAFLGAYRSAVSIPTSIITGLRGYPQSGISTSASLDDPSQYPLYARTIPGDDGTAIPVILYLRNVLDVKYLAILHVNDAYGSAYALGLQVAAQTYASDMVIENFSIPYDATKESIDRAIKFLKGTNYTFFFGIVFQNNFDDIMTEAYNQGIAGTGRHNWIFSDSTTNSIIKRTFEKGSALHLAFRGAGMISASGGLPGRMPRLDKLTMKLQELRNPTDLDYIGSLFPRHDHPNYGEGVPYVNEDDFLVTPELWAPFLYDATVALGLAACKAAAAAEDGLSFNGTSHFSQMLETQFNGTSGSLVLDQSTGTRTPTSAFFTLVNHVEDEIFDSQGEPTLVQYKQVITDIFQAGGWEQLEEYIFNDGTVITPPDLPPATLVENHLQKGLRAGGLSMCGFALLLAVGFAAWTRQNRKTRVVKASQPIFLYILCAGAFVFASAIIPLSIDDGIATFNGCEIACNAVPWLLSIGFSVIFSALFTKMYRINKILNAPNFKRIKVTAFDVVRPMIFILGANVIVLSLMTALSPSPWVVRIQSTDTFGRSTETTGFCSSDNRLPYLVTLGVINLGALLFSIIQSYKARHISTEFSESDYIFRAMVSILCVCFIGVPVLVIAQDNPAAFFFVFTGIIFVTCCSILLLIFLPKMRYVKKSKKQTGSRVTVSSFSADVQESSSNNRSDVEYEGTRILTTETRKQLLEKIEMLTRLLESANNRASMAEQVDGDSEDEPMIGNGGNGGEDDSCRKKYVKFASPTNTAFVDLEEPLNDANDLHANNDATSSDCSINESLWSRE